MTFSAFSAQDLAFMQLALEQAQQAAQGQEVPVGAVVVRAGEVIARAHNTTLASKDPTAHAEINALRAAAQVLGNHRLEDCTLYVTLEPCVMCSGAILSARLQRVVFGASEPKTGAVASVAQIFDNPQLNHHTQWLGGVLAQDCAHTMQAFFQQRRHAHQLQKTPLRDDALRPSETLWRSLNLPSHWSRFETQWPALQGLRLHWFDNRTDASAQTSPLVYLHGLESWSAAYLTSMGSGQPALALDLIGFGLSDKPKKEVWHCMAQHVDLLRDFLLHAAPNAQGVRVAPSMEGLMTAAQTRLPHIKFDLLPQEPSLSNALQRAPYPDAGHEAGPRAMRALLL